MNPYDVSKLKPKAWINAIADEGNKQEMLWYLYELDDECDRLTAKIEELKTSATPEELRIDEEVVRFLLGEGSLDGLWYGDKIPAHDDRPPYWWRTRFRAMVGRPILSYDKERKTIVESAPSPLGTIKDG